MAQQQLHFQSLGTNDEELALGNVPFEEDEHGYLKPKENRVSQSLIAQLPSRHLDSLLDNELEEKFKPTSSLRRKDSHYRTLQLKNATLNSRNKSIDAEKIYQILNSDPNVNEEEKIKTLREMHQSLTVKRQVKEKLDAEWKKKIASRSLGSFHRLKLSICMTLHQLLHEIKNLCYFFEPWHTSIKTIQGQFGSCVASYFIFLRWLLYLNLSNFFITFCFVVIPEIVNKNSSNVYSYLGNKTESFEIHNLLTGSGWLMDSLLYFGAYSSGRIQVIPGLSYNMPLAYLSSIAVNMLINLIAVSFSITVCYQKNYVDTAGDVKTVFCNKIFSAWDYAIETENAALLQKQAFCNDIKELLYSKRLSERRMTLSQTILQKFSFVVVTLFSIAVVVCVGYLTYYLLENKSVKVDIPILQHVTFAITVTVISSVFFYLLKFFTIFEAYLSKKMILYFTMIRVVILRTVMLGVVTYFWMIVYKPPRDQQTCYEAELGSEFYRLILVNFLVAVLIFAFMGEFVRKLIHTYITPRVSLKEFDIAYDTLDLIYFQTLAWLAMYYVPLASLIIVIILIIMFYIKMISMSSNCRPPKRSWSVNETQTFYLILTFLMFFFAAITVGYTIFALEPSYCGPFKDYENAGNVLSAIFFKSGLSHTAMDALRYITSPGVLFAVFCALCLVVHYMRAQAHAHVSVIKKIRETLILASKDKVFLLKLFDEAFSAQLRNKPSSRDNDLKKNESSNLSKTRNEESSSAFNTPNSVSKLSHRNVKHSESPKKNGSRSKGSPFPPHQPGFRHILDSS